jgi:hypothetical protein
MDCAKENATKVFTFYPGGRVFQDGGGRFEFGAVLSLLVIF